MGHYKIYVYAISKNESQFVDRWMDAVGEADGVVVADTGSEDDTVRKLRARGAAVYEETIEPWRFDTARNRALNHVPADADICVSTDLDEVFVPGWRRQLEEAWNDGCTQARCWFFWEEPARTKFLYEKIHLRHGFRWVHPVHEVLEYSGDRAENVVFVDAMKLYHKPDPNKSRAQYLPLLELSARENPHDVRTRFWLGREYVFRALYDQGVETLTAYLAMPGAVWDVERSAAMRYIAAAYRGKKDQDSALAWLFKAAAECGDIREPWLDMARLGYDTHNWPLALFAAHRGLAVTRIRDTYLTQADAWGYLLDDYAAIACYWLGFYDKGLGHAAKACALAPGDARLLNNLNMIEQKISSLSSKQPNNQTANQPDNQSTKQPIDQTTDQPNNRSTDQPNNQSTK